MKIILKKGGLSLNQFWLKRFIILGVNNSLIEFKNPMSHFNTNTLNVLLLKEIILVRLIIMMPYFFLVGITRIVSYLGFCFMGNYFPL